jgi:hypothetical protein
LTGGRTDLVVLEKTVLESVWPTTSINVVSHELGMKSITDVAMRAFNDPILVR